MIYNFQHRTIRTPSDTCNVIGAGGINQCTMTELYGAPGVGKSAFAYDSASMFLDDNPDGIVLIIDPELSVDITRFRDVFKMDLDRVILRNAPDLESGFAEIYRAINGLKAQAEEKHTTEEFIKKFIENPDYDALESIFGDVPEDIDIHKLGGKRYFGAEERRFIGKIASVLAFHGKLKPARPTPILIIWDTIAVSEPRDEIAVAMEAKGESMNSGGRQLRARVIKHEISMTLANMFQKPITIFFLNQIRKVAGAHPNAPMVDGSTGGNALRHNCHYRFKIHSPKKARNSAGTVIGTASKITIEKSKFSIEIEGIPIYIDSMAGGRIVAIDEAAHMCDSLGLITNNKSSWYRFLDEPDLAYTWERNVQSEKTGRWISNNPAVRKKCVELLARYYRTHYVTLDTVYKELGIKIGELTEEQATERRAIIDQYSFAPILVPEKARVQKTEV
jgi:RecA/RadA recombinase